MQTVNAYRHGDVLLVKTTIPNGVKLKAQKLLHKGTNNSHVISSGLVGEFEGRKYLRVKARATVSHVGGSATHASKVLPKGEYEIQIQQFYDHISEEAKAVVD
jgi:hypothetical protein